MARKQEMMKSTRTRIYGETVRQQVRHILFRRIFSRKHRTSSSSFETNFDF